MRVRGRKFEIDRSEGKMLGVCAGIANYSGIDVTIVRVAAVLLTLTGGFPWTLIAYFAAAFFGAPKRPGAYGMEEFRSRSPEEEQDRMRSFDLRMQAIETHTASANSRLAREIEELR